MAATKSRSRPGAVCTQAAGSPAAPSPSAMAAWMAPALAKLSEPPRRITALPDFRQMPAASAPTLGRLS